MWTFEQYSTEKEDPLISKSNKQIIRDQILVNVLFSFYFFDLNKKISFNFENTNENKEKNSKTK